MEYFSSRLQINPQSRRGKLKIKTLSDYQNFNMNTIGQQQTKKHAKFLTLNLTNSVSKDSQQRSITGLSPNIRINSTKNSSKQSFGFSNSKIGHFQLKDIAKENQELKAKIEKLIYENNQLKEENYQLKKRFDLSPESRKGSGKNSKTNIISSTAKINVVSPYNSFLKNNNIKNTTSKLYLKKSHLVSSSNEIGPEQIILPGDRKGDPLSRDKNKTVRVGLSKSGFGTTKSSTVDFETELSELKRRTRKILTRYYNYTQIDNEYK